MLCNVVRNMKHCFWNISFTFFLSFIFLHNLKGNGPCWGRQFLPHDAESCSLSVIQQTSRFFEDGIRKLLLWTSQIPAEVAKAEFQSYKICQKMHLSGKAWILWQWARMCLRPWVCRVFRTQTVPQVCTTLRNISHLSRCAFTRHTIQSSQCEIVPRWS